MSRPATTRLVLVTIAAFTLSVSAAHARQTQAKPEQKPEAKTETSLTGKWNVIVDSPNGTVDVTLDMKIDGKKVSGMIASQMGEAKIDGEYVDGKLSFTFTMDANGQSLNVAFKGAQQKDGTLAGTLDFGQGEMGWKGTRAK